MNEPSTKTIIVDPQSAPQIRLGFELYATGIYSLEQVVTQLNEKGLSTCKQNLSNVLKNPFCTGKIRLDAWKDEPEQIINGLHEALITKEVFNTCHLMEKGKSFPGLLQGKRICHCGDT